MITHAELLHICSYDPLTGLFAWRNPPYHKSKAGKPMGKLNYDGYIQIKINDVVYYAGPLAWFYMTGKWLAHKVDHKNRKRGDNRWTNLRPATSIQNAGNMEPHPKNKSGYRGVIKVVGGVRWRASIKRNDKTTNLGEFFLKETAAIAYDLSAHQHFGEFAMLNFATSPQRDWILV